MASMTAATLGFGESVVCRPGRRRWAGIATLLLALFCAAGCNREQSDWEEAKRENTVEACQRFLQEHPDGELRPEAQRLLAELIEKRDWREAQSRATIVGYEAYLTRHADAPRAADARAEIRRLQELAHWERVRSDPSVATAREFLEALPNGSLANEARALIERLEEERAWATAAELRSIEGFQTYLRAHPQGPHAAEAAALHAGLVEERDWSQALAQPTVEGFTRFLSSHPDSRHAAEAKTRLREARLAAAWRAASETNTVKAYEEFLSAWPNSAHAPEAEQRIAFLHERRAWAEVKKTNTPEAYTKFLSERGFEWSVTNEIRKQVLEGLVKVYATGNASTKKTSALHLAALAGSPQLASMALADGIEIDARDETWHTALHVAAQHGHAQTAAFLLDRGASIERATAAGWTALGLARKGDHAPTVTLLESRGAKDVPPPPQGVVSMAEIHIAKTTPRLAGAGYAPNYAKYSNIIHLMSTVSIGTSGDSEQVIKAGNRTVKIKKKGGYKVYAILVNGKDPRSGRSRGISHTFDLAAALFGGKPRDTGPSCGKPGTRITFCGDRDVPFEPFRGLRLWQGSIDIDPKLGLVILPGTQYEIAKPAGAPGAPTASPQSKAPPYLFPGLERALKALDWELVGESLANLLPALEELVTEAARGEMSMANLKEIQRWNEPLAGQRIKLARFGVPGLGANGRFCHPGVAANVIHVTLRKMGYELSKDQAESLEKIGRRYVEEDRRRREAYGEEGFKLRQLLDEIALKDRFFAEAYALLTAAQLDALRPASIRGTTRADLLSSACQWQPIARPMPLESRDQLADRMSQLILEQFKIGAASHESVQRLTSEWAKGLPDALFRLETGAAAFGWQHADLTRAFAEEELKLYETLVRQLDLTPEMEKKIRDALVVAVPYRKKAKR